MEISENLYKLIYGTFTINIDSFCPLKESWKISSWINNSFLVSLGKWALPLCCFDFILLWKLSFPNSIPL